MVGETISHYRITEKLGEGGMGVVYRATDLRLDRDVALKLLSAHLADDADARSRFLREAKAAAALDHTNICTVYEVDEVDDRALLAMQLIEGPTVKERIAERPLKLDEALDIASQAARGLQAAHEKGIVHRDIKSANLMLTADGQVKIMDFGLARLADHTQITKTATILGTPAYMSPEQAQGRPVDRRSDIFSFGVVLYEMVTGRLPFFAENDQSAIYAIINQEPEPPTALRSGIPRELDGIVGKTLAKNPDERYQHIEDLLVDVRKLKTREDSTSGQSGIQPARPNKTGWYVAAIMTIALVAVLLTWIGARRAPVEVADAEMNIVHLTTYPGREDNPDFSPDGTQVAFDGNVEDENNTDIYVRMIGSAGLSRLTTNPARDTSPRWSPDGRSIAFLRWTRPGEKNDLMVMPSIGGQARKIAEIGPFTWESRPPYFDWAPDGKHLVGVDRATDDDPLSLYLITTTGDERRRLTSSLSVGKANGDGGPSFSPDGRLLAFANRTQSTSTGIYSLELSNDLVPVEEPKQLTSSGDQWRVAPVWTANGRDIIYRVAQQRDLWRLPSDGSEKPSRLAIAGNLVGSHAIDPVGDKLIFSQATTDSSIWRVELSGAGKGSDAGAPFIASSRADFWPQYSPDGQRIAFQSRRSGVTGIWVCDADGKNAAKLFVPESGQAAGTPRWSPDGRFIAIDSNHAGQWDIYLIRADGGTPMALTADGAGGISPSWSRDGKWVYFSSARSRRLEIWKSSADGTETVQVTRTGAGVAFESWDSKHVYYTKAPGQISSLWRVPADGGEEQQVLEEVWWRCFAVTEGGIYFMKPPTRDEEFFSIRRLDPDTGEVADVVSLEVALNDPRRDVRLGITVSPDQRSILYVQSQSTSDLMLVENFR